MQNALNSVQLKKLNSSVFDFSQDRKLSCNMGFLYPVFVEDCIPGDRWALSQEAMVRLAPLVFPMMQRVDVKFECFFVPDRLLWPGTTPGQTQFEKWITGEKVAGLDPAVPYFNLNAPTVYTSGGLCDHMGLPDPNGTDVNIAAKYNAAYQFIWNEFYRDENLQTTKMNYALVDGDNSSNLDLFKLQRRAWEHDYFTSCLPFAQKGDPVQLPIGTFRDVPVKRDAPGSNTVLTGTPDSVTLDYLETDSPIVDPLEMYAQTSALVETATTIKDFRRALKLQEFLERSAVSGTRYTEFLYGMFNESNGDATLQRPQYITGAKFPIQISEVLNTTGPTGADDPLQQGNMSGHGIVI